MLGQESGGAALYQVAVYGQFGGFFREEDGEAGQGARGRGGDECEVTGVKSFTFFLKAITFFSEREAIDRW